MGKICWNKVASIGIIVFSQTAFAAPNGRLAMVAGDSTYRNVPQPDDPKNDARLVASAGDFSFALSSSGGQLELGKASVGLLAQAGDPAAAETTPPLDSSEPHDQSPPAIPSRSKTRPTTVVARAAPTAVGCGLKYLTAEIAGKLKGRKWKEFREEECRAISTQAVFPSMIAPRYTGESPDKARMLTCADQFTANKATNANDGLKWIDKGGGYYSECVSRLKG
jgi:hypothetical protein